MRTSGLISATSMPWALQWDASVRFASSAMLALANIPRPRVLREPSWTSPRNPPSMPPTAKLAVENSALAAPLPVAK